MSHSYPRQQWCEIEFVGYSPVRQARGILSCLEGSAQGRPGRVLGAQAFIMVHGFPV